MKQLSLVLLAALFVLSACDSKNAKVDKPAELTDLKNPTVRIQKVWGASVGGGGKKLRLGLGLAVAGNKLFASGREGDVAAFDLKTGKQLWRIETKLELAGGTGVGADTIAVGSADGQVVALAMDTGAQRWRADVKGEILSAPAVGVREVIVRTVDGKLRALALEDGKELWSTEQQIPRLTLRGAAAPVVIRDIAISGFDNGRVLAVNLADGSTVWDSPVSPPHGRTELERLNDIDAPVKVEGEEVFVAGYQGRAAMLALDSGQVWWTREVSSYRGVDVDAEHMYLSSSQGELLAITRRTGQPVWANFALRLRSLSAPVVAGEYVVVADLEGYVHYFDRATGELAGRIKSGGDRVTNSPVAVGDVVYVVTDKGDIFALHGTPVASRAAKAEAPPAAPEPEPAAAPAPGG